MAVAAESEYSAKAPTALAAVVAVQAGQTAAQVAAQILAAYMAAALVQTAPPVAEQSESFIPATPARSHQQTQATYKEESWNCLSESKTASRLNTQFLATISA
jgi:hypothetical protein